MHFRFIDPTNYDEKRDLVTHISTVHCVLVFPRVLWTTWWWPICRAETCSCFYLMLLCYWLNIHIYVCVCVCVYIYIYTVCFVLLTKCHIHPQSMSFLTPIFMRLRITQLCCVNILHAKFCRNWPINVKCTCRNRTVRGSNPGGGEIFRNCPDRTWGPPSLLFNGYSVFPGGKVRPGRDADPSPLSSAEVKNRVGLYLYSP
jgi:hypothetical protein